jgi:hypothetical protein
VFGIIRSAGCSDASHGCDEVQVHSEVAWMYALMAGAAPSTLLAGSDLPAHHISLASPLNALLQTALPAIVTPK